MSLTLDGALRPGVGAKDVILHAIGALGVEGAAGAAVELRGDVVRAMPRGDASPQPVAT